MRKSYYLVIISLLISLFIYLFYRTEKTVITDLFISLISAENYFGLKNSITTALPLNELIIYSLPEGLWIFCITITSKNLFLKLGNHEINLIFLPLIFCIGLELFQLLRITNGRFDFLDILISVLFWAVANYLLSIKTSKQNIFKPFTTRSLVCVLSYVIVYLAHVWQ